MTSREISGDAVSGSPNNNLPIKLPDGRFIKVCGWRLSSPPKPRHKMLIVEYKDYKRYAVAQLIDEENI